MQVVEGFAIGVRLQLDHAAAPDVGSGFERAPGEDRCDLHVLGDPHAVLVCLRRCVIPEPVALHVPVGAGEGRETRIAGGLPIDVDKVFPFPRIGCLVVTVHDHVSGFLHDGEYSVSVLIHRVVPFHPTACPPDRLHPRTRSRRTRGRNRVCQYGLDHTIPCIQGDGDRDGGVQGFHRSSHGNPRRPLDGLEKFGRHSVGL